MGSVYYNIWNRMLLFVEHSLVFQHLHRPIALCYLDMDDVKHHNIRRGMRVSMSFISELGKNGS